MKELKNNRGQQEIVGFVLIVVLVMVALMVFLIISVRDGGDVVDSVGVSNMLDVLMRTTTDCAVVAVPEYSSFEDLFKSCYNGDLCSNLNSSACEYLNESLMDMISSMVRSDASVEGWSVEFSGPDGEEILRWEEENCTGQFSGAQRSIVSSKRERMAVHLRICED